MSVWTETADTWMGLEANFEPWCLFHPKQKTMMNLFDTKLLIFQLWKGAKKSHAIDVVLYCPHCGYQDTFGVAISKEHYKRQYWKIKKLMWSNRWHGFVTDPFNFIYVHTGDILTKWIRKAKRLIVKF